MAKRPGKTTANPAPAPEINPTSSPAVMVDASPLSMTVLAAVVEATKNNTMYYVSPADGLGLVNAGLIIVEPSLLDPSDNTKAYCRATPEGMAMINESNEADKAAGGSETAAKFTIRTDVAIASKRGRASGGGAHYPFDLLPVGGSFHVPVTEKMPKPHKTLGSAVSIATRKYASQDGYEQNADGTPKLDKKGNQIAKWKTSRVFSVRAVDASDPDGVGARVFRTA